MVRVLQETLAQCEEDGQERNDQELFWNVMNEEIRSRRIQHCREYNNINNNNNTVVVNASEKKPEICCLDPYYYRTGQHKPENSSEPYIVHANFVSGMKNKTELLADFVDGWSLPPPYE